jgi:G3E family GTPase
MSASNPIPVTVLTGFLGSGKTTLVNHLLQQPHGLRIAVIENEFGESSIDHELLVTTEETIVELSNGCLCCTVRGDLVEALQKLALRSPAPEYVLIETTGVARPTPVVQTFLAGDALADQFVLDGVVTVVDSKHAPRHLESTLECREQIAFADVVLINKTDLVSPEELHALEHRIQHLNPTARRIKIQQGAIAPREILGIQAFEPTEQLLSQVDVDKKHSAEHGQEGHECGGSCDHHHHDHDHHHHDHHHHEDHAHGHSHGTDISSVSLELDGRVDEKRFTYWFRGLLAECEEDLFRTKGILAVKGHASRWVLQGVHSLLDLAPGRPWKNAETPNCRLVFIGKNLNAEELRKGFLSTKA